MVNQKESAEETERERIRETERECVWEKNLYHKDNFFKNIDNKGKVYNYSYGYYLFVLRWCNNDWIPDNSRIPLHIFYMHSIQWSFYFIHSKMNKISKYSI